MTASPSNEETLQPTHGSVLIVDDEVELANALSEMLIRHGFTTESFTNGLAAIERLKVNPFDVMLADLMMPEIGGISLMKAALKIDPHMSCILMTGQGTVQTAVEAMKNGAFDYLLKPFKRNTVLTALHRSMEIRNLRKENVQLRELVNIYELGQAVASSLDIQEILRMTCEAAVQVCQADESSILLPGGNTQELEVVAAYGKAREDLIGLCVPVTGSISGWVASEMDTVTLDGQVEDARFSAVHPREEIQTALSMPIALGKKLIGVINVNKTQQSEEFNEGQLKGLSILSHMAASAVENARLYEQSEKQLKRLEALRNIDLAITSGLDLRLILNIVLEQVQAQLDAETAAILLYDSNTQMLDYAAGRGFHTQAIEDAQTLLGLGHAGAAAYERSTVVIPHLQEVNNDPMLEVIRVSENIQALVATPLMAKGEVKGVLMVFCPSPFEPDREWLDFLEALAGQAAIAIDSARLFENLQRSNQQLMLAYNTTIEGWSRALDLRDRETEGHTRRVMDMTLKLAQFMNVFDETELVHLRRGALLHDIGKMGVPDEILHKPGDLNEEEEQVMKKHPEYAYQLLYPIIYLRQALDIPYYHHERWDGEGYPRGLKGEEIPLAARIFSVVDVWDALRSDRPYRAGWHEEQVMGYIREQSGKHFDPNVVEAFLQMRSQED
jgi:response regulator RpfG family c-di-GMP phosphodiesterase